MRAANLSVAGRAGTIEDMSMTSAPRRLRGRALLAAIAQGTAGTVGEEFLLCLVRHVAQAFAAPPRLRRRGGRRRAGASTCSPAGSRRVPRGALHLRDGGHALRASARAPVGPSPDALAARFPDDPRGDRARPGQLPRGLPARLGRAPPRPLGRPRRHAPWRSPTRTSRRCASSPPVPPRSSSGASRRAASRPRARASSRPPTPSAGAWGATSTTARSSASSPSPPAPPARAGRRPRRGARRSRPRRRARRRARRPARARPRPVSRRPRRARLAGRPGLPAAGLPLPVALAHEADPARGRRHGGVLPRRGVPRQCGAPRGADASASRASGLPTGLSSSRWRTAAPAAPTWRPAPACRGLADRMAVLPGGRLRCRVARRRRHARAGRDPAGGLMPDQLHFTAPPRPTR